jgi:hypothetical protein
MGFLVQNGRIGRPELALHDSGMAMNLGSNRHGTILDVSAVIVLEST